MWFNFSFVPVLLLIVITYCSKQIYKGCPFYFISTNWLYSSISLYYHYHHYTVCFIYYSSEITITGKQKTIICFFKISLICRLEQTMLESNLRKLITLISFTLICLERHYKFAKMLHKYLLFRNGWNVFSRKLYLFSFAEHSLCRLCNAAIKNVAPVLQRIFSACRWKTRFKEPAW